MRSSGLRSFPVISFSTNLQPTRRSWLACTTKIALTVGPTRSHHVLGEQGLGAGWSCIAINRFGREYLSSFKWTATLYKVIIRYTRTIFKPWLRLSFHLPWRDLCMTGHTKTCGLRRGCPCSSVVLRKPGKITNVLACPFSR